MLAKRVVAQVVEFLDRRGFDPAVYPLDLLPLWLVTFAIRPVRDAMTLKTD